MSLTKHARGRAELALVAVLANAALSHQLIAPDEREKRKRHRGVNELRCVSRCMSKEKQERECRNGWEFPNVDGPHGLPSSPQ
jgi:hypothetical protein